MFIFFTYPYSLLDYIQMNNLLHIKFPSLLLTSAVLSFYEGKLKWRRSQKTLSFIEEKNAYK